MTDQLTAREANALDELDQMRARAETAEHDWATAIAERDALHQHLASITAARDIYLNHLHTIRDLVWTKPHPTDPTANTIRDIFRHGTGGPVMRGHGVASVGRVACAEEAVGGVSGVGAGVGAGVGVLSPQAGSQAAVCVGWQRCIVTPVVEPLCGYAWHAETRRPAWRRHPSCPHRCAAAAGAHLTDRHRCLCGATTPMEETDR